ncbi:carboxymuconolactone decarboxylase family protein [Paraburkholderia sp.]|uniref:carboxymuconolactone decarboxylase family protein n=1 Tax=Paraburkholderia sp. TaxID=1926495 RepID=UPI00239A4197|nr:carboxymuconolactone decarboxylase family protein [Paraburkholderia sp.]MDE1182173.1 carboxymuconolactone decarboxylase family protein [Paraburkholderia sp.]
MTLYRIHTLASAPEQSRPVLDALQQNFGIIPNIAGTMAESPVLIGGFIGLFQKVHSGNLTEAQIQTLLLTNAVTNACTWAVAFHTALALKEGLTPSDVQAIRERRLPADRSHAALSHLTKTLIETRGHLDDRDIDAFIDAGFDKARLLEVIGVCAASTITNYVGNTARPALEAQFHAYAWTA